MKIIYDESGFLSGAGYSEGNFLGLVGLGRMGANISENLLDNGTGISVYDISKNEVDSLLEKRKDDFEKGRLKGCYSIGSLADSVESPRSFLFMINQKGVDETILSLVPYLRKGDVIIDGGNSFYKDSMRRASELKELGIGYLDMGTSGGIGGAREGVCAMVGGDEGVFKDKEWIFKRIAKKEGYQYIGPSGSGHFVKMVHNILEYAMEQAIGEGIALAKSGLENIFGVGNEKLPEICRLWNNGSIIKSRLLNDLETALNKDSCLSDITSEIGGGETGEWGIQTAMELKVPCNSFSVALNERYRSRLGNESFAGKAIAGMRNVFGEHEVKKK